MNRNVIGAVVALFICLYGCKESDAVLNQQIEELTIEGEHAWTIGDVKTAEDIFLDALKKSNDRFGEVNSHTIKLMKSLGRLYRTTGRYTESKQYFDRLLNVIEKVFKEDHLQYIETLNDLGILAVAMKNYPTAEEYFARALAQAEQRFGASHPLVTFTLDNYGDLYAAMGRYQKAEQYYSEVLVTLQESLGEENVQVATMYKKLANVYIEQGDYGRATPLLEKALEIFKLHYPDQHPYINGIQITLDHLKGEGADVPAQ